MEVLKRTISFEPSTVRYSGGTYPYGTMTADTFFINIMLTQNVDDMGLFTDIDFIPESQLSTDQPDYTILTNKLTASGITFPFMYGTQPLTPTGIVDNTNIRLVGDDLSDYWNYGNNKITGATDSKKTDVKSYSNTQPYQTGFDVDTTIYTNYIGATIDGRTRITDQSLPSYSAITYVFDANNDVNIGTTNQSSGIRYTDYSGQSRTVVDEIGNIFSIPLTTMEYTSEGWNETNTSLSAVIKEEYLFGVTQVPEVQSDVFIDRGATTVLEKHLRLSEIESLEHFERYTNGFYKLVKQ